MGSDHCLEYLLYVSLGLPTINFKSGNQLTLRVSRYFREPAAAIRCEPGHSVAEIPKPTSKV